MGQFIVKLAGRYIVWSTVVDAPVTYGMTLDELREHVQQRDGSNGLAALASRLERVEQYGTSSPHHESPDEVMWLNRAGRNETALTKAQIIEHYIKRKTPDDKLPIGAPNPVFPDDEDDSDSWTLERYLGERPSEEP